ncbi:DUF86 domain-containing protein [Emticicia sp.]|uniref:HepT-like ribonuclease domain-containing protein n=1 Tax=Emticicia sp. TaxID=1930953 RepID=UPI003752B2F3
MSDEVKKCLQDIIDSINSIDEYLGENRSFIYYEQNKQLRRSVEREIEIAGEAMNRVIKFDENLKIENGKNLINMRNRIIHAYDAIDNAIIWNIVQ